MSDNTKQGAHTADDSAWIASMRRTCDAFKIAITSKVEVRGIASESDLAALASRAESIFKEARALIGEEAK